MAPSPRTPAVRAVKAALAGALLGGAALFLGAPAGAQPAPPPDPAPPPLPLPAGVPFIPPVPNADFNNTGQFDFLRDLMVMGNSTEFFQSIAPTAMDPTTWVPPAPFGTMPPPPAPAPGSPPVPASAPPPVWPPMPIPAPVP